MFRDSTRLKVDVPDEKFAITACIAGLGVQSKDMMFSISKNLRQAWLRCSPKQRSISTVKKPFFPSKGDLLLKRRRAGVTRNGNEAPRGKETGADPCGGTKKT